MNDARIGRALNSSPDLGAKSFCEAVESTLGKNQGELYQSLNQGGEWNTWARCKGVTHSDPLHTTWGPDIIPHRRQSGGRLQA